MTDLTLYQLNAYMTLPTKLARAGKFLTHTARTAGARDRKRMGRLVNPVFVNDIVPVTDDEIQQVKKDFTTACASLGHVQHIPAFDALANNAHGVRNALSIDYSAAVNYVPPVEIIRLTSAIGASTDYHRFRQCDDILYVLQMCKPSHADIKNLLDDTLTVIGYRRLDRNLFQYLNRVQGVLRRARTVTRQAAA